MLTTTPTVSAEELAQELEKVPEQYWANLLQIIRLFRESVAPIPGDYSRNYAISEAIEDIGLVHAMQEVKDEIPLSLQEALAEMEKE
jgi:hypothetical protein